MWEVLRVSFLRVLYSGWVRAWYAAEQRRGDGDVGGYDPRLTMVLTLRGVRWQMMLDWRFCTERVTMVQRNGRVLSGESPERLHREFRERWVAAGWARVEGSRMIVLISHAHPVAVDVVV